MNNETDGNLAAIESYLNGQDDEDKCLWHHPEAIPDAIRI